MGCLGVAELLGGVGLGVGLSFGVLLNRAAPVMPPRVPHAPLRGCPRYTTVSVGVGVGDLKWRVESLSGGIMVSVMSTPSGGNRDARSAQTPADNKYTYIIDTFLGGMLD